ncbi:hypothetical protein [Streptomyces demainii]|uniref:Uncharacterized protein n=1 Tax=Streptomyces demainii TaxID=588122 RepID=A0ABT9L672_9ACTN|nr:hypothetical protein [Streptomyces demainii]MDP9616201.1 hypothetical protein [Streptomyces demainii]
MSDNTSADGGNDFTAPVISVGPIALAAPDRGRDPRVRVTASTATDGYRLSPGATDPRAPFGAEHGVGGIQGANDTRTTDESPERIALVRQATLVYPPTALGLDHDAWPTARRTPTAAGAPLGSVGSK